MLSKEISSPLREHDPPPPHTRNIRRATCRVKRKCDSLECLKRKRKKRTLPDRIHRNDCFPSPPAFPAEDLSYSPRTKVFQEHTEFCETFTLTSQHALVLVHVTRIYYHLCDKRALQCGNKYTRLKGPWTLHSLMQVTSTLTAYLACTQP